MKIVIVNDIVIMIPHQSILPSLIFLQSDGLELTDNIRTPILIKVEKFSVEKPNVIRDDPDNLVRAHTLVQQVKNSVRSGLSGSDDAVLT